MTALMPGGNVPVAAGSLQIDVHYSPLPGIDIDIFHIPARQKETLCEHVCGTQVPFMNHVRSVHQCEGH